MGSGILISLREGVEAFLVVGILLGYLRKMGQQRHSKYIWTGVLAAVAVSVLLALGLQALALQLEGAAEELFEAGVALVAVGVLTYMVLWMQRQSRSIKAELEAKMEKAISMGQVYALASLAFVTVLREGLETALFLSAVAATAGAGLLLGAVIGLFVAAAIVYVVFASTVRLNLRVFFVVTGGLIIFIAAGLLVHITHALQEIGWVSWVISPLWDTSRYIADESALGRLLHAFIGYQAQPSLVQVLVYGAYVLLFWGLFLRAIAASRKVVEMPKVQAPDKMSHTTRS